MGLYDEGPSPTSAAIFIVVIMCLTIISCGYQFVLIQNKQTRAEEIRAASLLCRTEEICLPVYKMIGVADEIEKRK